MKRNHFLVILSILFLMSACQDHEIDKNSLVMADSTELSIEARVNQIIAKQDSLVVIPSLRFAKGADETYTAKMYGENQITLKIREEEISNKKILGRDYYYDNRELIFIKEEGSVFDEAGEIYTEKLIYMFEGSVYKAYKKHQYTEDDMFVDTLYETAEVKLQELDLEKPYRALQQQAEFAMYFDQFLLIEPQSYLIVENEDKSINAALYIIEGDSLLDELFENPDLYQGQKLWLYHSFREMNGIERMIYEGAVLIQGD